MTTIKYDNVGRAFTPGCKALANNAFFSCDNCQLKPGSEECWAEKIAKGLVWSPRRIKKFDKPWEV